MGSEKLACVCPTCAHTAINTLLPLSFSLAADVYTRVRTLPTLFSPRTLVLGVHVPLHLGGGDILCPSAKKSGTPTFT